MTKDQLARAAQQIADLLENCGLKDALKQALLRKNQGGTAGDASPSVIDAYQSFSALSRRFDVAERRVLKALKLGFLQHTEFWVRFLQNKLEPEMIRNALERVYLAQKYLPGWVDLVKNEIELELEKPVPERNAALVDQEMLTVLTRQERDMPPSVREVQGVMTSVDVFHDACSLLTGKSGALTFLGSEICFGMRMQFVGPAETIRLIKESILSIWDRRQVMLNNPEGFCASDRIDDIPAFALLRERIDNGEIDGVLGGQIHTMLCEAFELFLGAGASIPELERAVEEDSDLLIDSSLASEQTPHRPKVVAIRSAPARSRDASFDAWENEREQLLKLVDERGI